MKKEFWDKIREREEKNINREEIVKILIKMKNEDDKENEVEKNKGVRKGDEEGDVYVLKGDMLVEKDEILLVEGFERKDKIK